MPCRTSAARACYHTQCRISSAHLNYAPEDVGQNVDKWHVDTLRFDFVLFVTDPTKVSGGEFEYFRGTKHDVARLTGEGQPLPADKVVSVSPPGPGYAVMQQGNMVVHRAKGLSAPGERITLVNGYVPADIRFPDYTRYDQLFLVDPPHVITSEYARHVAWMGRELLAEHTAAPNYSADRNRFAAEPGGCRPVPGKGRQRNPRCRKCAHRTLWRRLDGRRQSLGSPLAKQPKRMSAASEAIGGRPP